MADLYVDAGEEVPPNSLKTSGKLVQVKKIVDSYHAGDIATWQYQTGIILYCNSSLIITYSKRLNIVESSTFGEEFVALQIAMDLIVSLSYKLIIFWVPIKVAANCFCENEYVYRNA